MIRDTIAKLRQIADALESVMNELESISVPPSPKVMLDKQREWPSKAEFISKWTAPNPDQELGRLVRKHGEKELIKVMNEGFNETGQSIKKDKKKLHWTQRPENRARVRKQMLKALKIKMKNKK